MKVLVLCDAVTPESGPLTFLPAAPSETLHRKVTYKYNTRLTDTQMRELLGPAAVAPTAIFGPAGTTAFLDTSRCFHFGSRCATRARLASDAHDEVTRVVLGAA